MDIAEKILAHLNRKISDLVSSHNSLYQQQQKLLAENQQLRDKNQQARAKIQTLLQKYQQSANHSAKYKENTKESAE